jgi:DNA polymerase-3 subunit delta'
MSFSEIIGQTKIIRLLRRALAQDLLPHAFLFTGVEGVGKKSTALTLAKVVNCQDSASGDCCDQCISCRKADNGNHPDINLIEREGPFIKIEQIRALKHRLRFKPLEGRYRVTVINNSQHLKVEAANALLKVLEEPPADNLIILTAIETTALLPTIVSRCLHLPFQPLASEEISAHLGKIHSISPERAAVIARLAGGSLSRALSLLDEKKLGRRNSILETVAEIHKSRLTDLLAAINRWKGDNLDLQEDLEWLKTWIRDLLVQKFEATDRVYLLNSDLAYKIKAMASQMSSDHLLRFFDLVCTVQGAIGYNVNRRLSLETLLLSFYLRATGRGKVMGADLPIAGRERFVWPVRIGG